MGETPRVAPSPEAVQRAWPAAWPALPPGGTRVASQQSVPLDAVTGSVQGEVSRGLVDAKRVQIERALAGEGRLPDVRVLPDPGGRGLVAIDGNHTLQAYRELGFREIPGYVYNDAGVRARIADGSFTPDRVFPAGEVRVVDRFSGSPREQFEARQAEAREAASCKSCAPAPAPVAEAGTQRPADADQAFQRAMRTGGSQVGNVVYGVGGTPDAPVVHRFSPDGRYLGSTTPDRIPVAAEMGVSEQMIRQQNPGTTGRRMVSAPDGRQYTVGQGGVQVDEGGTLRALSATERAALPSSVQRQLMLRAAGPMLAMPDGVNGMGRAIGREVAGNWIDGVQINMDIDQRFGRGAGAGDPGRMPPAPPPPRR